MSSVRRMCGRRSLALAHDLGTRSAALSRGHWDDRHGGAVLPQGLHRLGRPLPPRLIARPRPLAELLPRARLPVRRRCCGALLGALASVPATPGTGPILGIALWPLQPGPSQAKLAGQVVVVAADVVVVVGRVLRLQQLGAWGAVSVSS